MSGRDLYANLITPHGDWEPHTSMDCVVALKRLITPHGDWELSGMGATQIDLEKLITPHGDWEPRLVNHLPPHVLRLITPHGDWEHGIHRRPNTNTQSHYPSWGLGTNSYSAYRPCGVVSLPLMGIGNWLAIFGMTESH